jgi:hypothetical protein
MTKDYTKCLYKRKLLEGAEGEELEVKVSSKSKELTDYQSLPGDNKAEPPTDDNYYLSYLQVSALVSIKPVKVEPIEPTLKVAHLVKPWNMKGPYTNDVETGRIYNHEEWLVYWGKKDTQLQVEGKSEGSTYPGNKSTVIPPESDDENVLKETDSSLKHDLKDNK